MQKIYVTGLMVAAFVCLSVCSPKSPALVRTDDQKDVGGGHYNGPSDRFIEAMAESARRNPEAARLIEEGIGALERGDLARGEECFQRVLTGDPKFFGIHLLLGSTYLEQGKIEQGLAELRKEEEYHPGNPAVYQTTAKVLLETDNKLEALVSLRKWVAAEPTNLDAALKLGELLITSAKFNVKFPDSSPVRLFRRGMVFCGSVTGCDVVLLLPGSVHDAD